MVQDGRGGGIPAAGELLSLLRKEFRVIDIFFRRQECHRPYLRHRATATKGRFY